jgi:ankyrin repeat protein
MEPRDMMVDDSEEARYLSETPLHYGIRAKVYEATLWLLHHGAVKSIQDAQNKSPADYAAEDDDTRIVEIFQPSIEEFRGGSRSCLVGQDS